MVQNKKASKPTRKRKSPTSKCALKMTVVALCLAGFIFNTAHFLLLYWTYPVVMDIQESIASEPDLPGISFCNSNAIVPDTFCEMEAMCFPYFAIKFLKICDTFPEVCGSNLKVNDGFTLVAYHTFLRQYNLNATLLATLKQDVDYFLKCKILRGNEELECDMDNIMIGSYYSDTSIFNVCYTMNSLWGKSKKTLKKIRKYDKIVLDFFVDMTLLGRADSPDIERQPKSNVPTSSVSIQLAVHSPYISVSPFVSGLEFVGGKHYKVKLKRGEKHLLPPPYQTNCTDYMPAWFERGGIGPLNQIMVVEECKFNKTLEFYGCVPFSVDYPHNLSICAYCHNCTELSQFADECSALLDIYNQPCDSVAYKMHVEEANVFVEKTLRYNETGENETLVYAQKGFNCSFETRFVQKCQEVRIELLFDDFLITNMTYKPKIENLELFSVIGGYMGVYLGVSFVTMYDIGELVLLRMRSLLLKKKVMMKKNRIRANKIFVARAQSSTTGHRNTSFALKNSQF